MRMFVLTARRVPDVPSPLLVEVGERLRRLGHEVELGTPEQMLVDAVGLTPGHDLYLLKSHTEIPKASPQRSTMSRRSSDTA